MAAIGIERRLDSTTCSVAGTSIGTSIFDACSVSQRSGAGNNSRLLHLLDTSSTSAANDLPVFGHGASSSVAPSTNCRPASVISSIPHQDIERIDLQPAIAMTVGRTSKLQSAPLPENGFEFEYDIDEPVELEDRASTMYLPSSPAAGMMDSPRTKRRDPMLAVQGTGLSPRGLAPTGPLVGQQPASPSDAGAWLHRVDMHPWEQDEDGASFVSASTRTFPVANYPQQLPRGAAPRVAMSTGMQPRAPFVPAGRASPRGPRGRFVPPPAVPVTGSVPAGMRASSPQPPAVPGRATIYCPLDSCVEGQASPHALHAPSGSAILYRVQRVMGKTLVQRVKLSSGGSPGQAWVVPVASAAKQARPVAYTSPRKAQALQALAATSPYARALHASPISPSSSSAGGQRAKTRHVGLTGHVSSPYLASPLARSPQAKRGKGSPGQSAQVASPAQAGYSPAKLASMRQLAASSQAAASAIAQAWAGEGQAEGPSPVKATAIRLFAHGHDSSTGEHQGHGVRHGAEAPPEAEASEDIDIEALYDAEYGRTFSPCALDTAVPVVMGGYGETAWPAVVPAAAAHLPMSPVAAAPPRVPALSRGPARVPVVLATAGQAEAQTTKAPQSAQPAPLGGSPVGMQPLADPGKPGHVSMHGPVAGKSVRLGPPKRVPMGQTKEQVAAPPLPSRYASPAGLSGAPVAGVTEQQKPVPPSAGLARARAGGGSPAQAPTAQLKAKAPMPATSPVALHGLRARVAAHASPIGFTGTAYHRAAPMPVIG